MIRMDRNIPFVRAALDGSYEEAVAELRAAEHRHGLRWFNSPANLDEDNSQEWYEQRLWPFLSETSMVLSAGDLFATGCLLLDLNSVDHTPSWRHWGEILAGWANKHWVSRPAGLGTTDWLRANRPWQYLDFYSQGYLSPVIAEYDVWRSAVWKVLAISGGGAVPDVGNNPGR